MEIGKGERREGRGEMTEGRKREEKDRKWEGGCYGDTKKIEMGRWLLWGYKKNWSQDPLPLHSFLIKQPITLLQLVNVPSIACTWRCIIRPGGPWQVCNLDFTIAT